MGDNLKWVFELVDRVSGPAKKMTTVTEGFDSELKKVRAQIDKIKMDPGSFKALTSARKELSKLKNSAGGSWQGKLLGGMTSLRNIEAVRLLGDGLQFAYRSARAVAGAMVSIGERIAGAAGEQERYNIAFKGMLGEKNGQQMLDFLDKLSVKTELTHSKIQELAARVVKAGFKGQDVGTVLAGTLDMGGFAGGGAANVEAAISAIERLKVTGEVSSRSLLALGISSQSVFARLQKETGKNQADFEKGIRNGTISTMTAVQAVLEEVQAKENGNPLGTMALKMGQTLTAQITHLGELPDRYFQKLSNSPGMDAAKKALGNLLAQLDPNSENGTRILASLNTAISNIATKFSTMITPENITAATNEITDLIDDLSKLPSIIDEVVKGIEIFGTIFVASKLVTGITALTGAIGVGAAPVILAAAAFVSLANAIALVVRNKKELGEDFDFIIHGMHHAVSKGNSGYAAMQEQNQRNLELAHRLHPDLVASQSASSPAPSMNVARGGASNHQSISIGAVHFDGSNITNGEEAAEQFKKAMSRPGTLQSGTELMSLESGAG